jgi:hypothetical protein
VKAYWPAEEFLKARVSVIDGYSILLSFYFKFLQAVCLALHYSLYSEGHVKNAGFCEMLKDATDCVGFTDKMSLAVSG